jgi:hypothetical protein
MTHSGIRLDRFNSLGITNRGIDCAIEFALAMKTLNW